MSNTTEAVVFLSNAGAGASAAFKLKGGKYMLTWQATLSAGNLQLQTLAGDGSSWVNVGAAQSALGAFTYDLAPGQYRVNITTSTVNYAVIATVPY